MSAASDESVNRLSSNDTAEPLSAPDEILAVLAANHRDPFAFLGLHDWGDHEGVLRVFQPAAEAVSVVDAATGAQIGMMTPRQGRRFFDLRLTAAQTARLREVGYRLRVAMPEGPGDLDDPYRFPPTLGELDLHLIGEGTHLRIYKRLGARPLTLDGVTGTAFAAWAPSASRVAVVGDFNGWDGRVHGMRFHPDCGVWDIFLPGVGPGACYKFEIKGASGRTLPLKADPFGLAAEHPPRTGSVVHHPRPYPWTDDAWMARRARDQGREAPLSIYEVHLASWAREPAVGSRGGRYLSYDELGDRLIPYARGLGFTHLELLPITEYPFDGSWGYQPLGLFAPTSRHGDPVAFQRFVDRCHAVGLGVLLDWVPGHFPTDEHGLAGFDGTHLFEHADPRQGFHLDWNTLIYNFGRREVANYLLSNALFWLDRYHLDGLRVDAVASMLYLDYSRKDGEWVPNRYGGRENLEAIDFLKRLNETVYGQFPGAITIAEESTAWPAVSRPTYAGGLGFGFKWNMGWMHDTLAYFSREPIHRRWHHNHLTFGLLYAFSENFILPLSHDEVVHGKRSLIGKMAGDPWQRFANLRAYYAFMWCHPGKKLMFMGGEFAQEREWNHDQGLDWQLLEQPRHRGVQRLVSDLNRVYRTLPALHQLDGEPAGFEWVDCTDSEHSVISFLRWGRSPGTPPVLVVCNLTPMVRAGYRVGAPAPGVWREVINTDADVYGGSGVGNFGQVRAQEISWHQRPYSLRLTLPPLATLVLTPAREPDAQDSWKPDPEEAWDPGAEPQESTAQGDRTSANAAPANEAPGNKAPADDGTESVRGRESGW